MDFVKITSIFDPFNWNNRSIVPVEYVNEETVEYYVSKISDCVSLDTFAVGLNGKAIEDLSIVVNKYDHITICPILYGGGGGGGKNIFRTVAMIAVTVVAAWVTGGAGGWFVAGSVQASVAGAAVMVGGAMLINAIMPVKQKPLDHDLEASSNNTWEMTNQSTEGATLPVLYGTRKIAPTVVSHHITLDGNDQYLNVLYAIHDGTIDDIRFITINDNELENYDNVELEFRNGFEDQEVIPWFNDTIYETLIHQVIDPEFEIVEIEAEDKLEPGEDWSEVITTPKDTASICLNFNFPSGLYISKVVYATGSSSDGVHGGDHGSASAGSDPGGGGYGNDAHGGMGC